MEVPVHRTLVDKQCYLQNRSPRSILRRCLRGKFDHIDCWRWSKMIHSSCSFRQKDLVEEETLVVESVEEMTEEVHCHKVHFDNPLHNRRHLHHTILQRSSKRLGTRPLHKLRRRSRCRSAIELRRQLRWWKEGKRRLVFSLKRMLYYQLRK